jgi:hypothetical protein
MMSGWPGVNIVGTDIAANEKAIARRGKSLESHGCLGGNGLGIGLAFRVEWMRGETREISAAA